ncbi:hypothetical protein KC19_8G051700 [Ceratodon purpureus]|uniref:SMP-30/Gluconolactonase/LRE-like region domain-containing protein n=1 Tax=Ceratodon purpureus TaxID=3225 RepID=A0A8T0H3M3_CERPU|nr:hypothetical protein KC19_8G050700 [Ceratodon purpureus]KAG0563692.1 hypothetical protein KC19_8G051700 [Ceratodon purpureus]
MKPLICFVLLFLQLCFLDEASGERSLKRFQFQEHKLFPESFDYDRMHDRFLIGSEFHGTVSELGNDGSFQEFIRDGEYAGKAGIAGVKVDSRRNRVIVTVADTVGWSYGGVAAYNLDTKERIYFARLEGVGVAEGEKFCANDVAVNFKTGDVYVTNSFGNFLWKVTKDGIPSVFVKHESFTSQPVIVDNDFNFVGFNGIIYEPGKFVLAVQTNSGALFRVGVEDGSVHKVIIKGNQTFPMADGMVLRDDGTLVVVSAEKIWLVGSASRWMAANVVDTVLLNASDVTTAAAVKRGATFVLHSYLSDMFAGQSRDEFEIREIEFPAEVADSDPVWLIILIVVVVVAVSLWRFQMGHFYEQYRRKRV